MLKIKNNDYYAFETLYKRYNNRLFNFLYRLSGDFVLSEDCLQETFIKLWRSKASYDLDKPLLPYLYQIARNVFYSQKSFFSKINFLKLFFVEHKEEDYEKEFEIHFSKDERQESELEKKEMLMIIEKSLAKISLKEREPFILTQIEKISYEEASKILKIPIGTVKSRTVRCIEKLRRYLKDKNVDFNVDK